MYKTLKLEEMNETIGSISCVQSTPPGAKVEFRKHEFMWKYSLNFLCPIRIPYKIKFKTFSFETGVKPADDELPVADKGCFWWVQKISDDSINLYFSTEEEAKRILKEIEEGGFFEVLIEAYNECLEK